MDLSWCPVCDQQTFALENLYCSEACRRKDELNLSRTQKGPSFISESFYEYPRRASRKQHQSPYNISPPNSPIQYPQMSSPIYGDSDCYYYAAGSVSDSEEETKFSSSPSELLQLSRTPPKSKARTLVPMTYLACKEAISSLSIRKKRSFLVNNLSAQHFL